MTPEHFIYKSDGLYYMQNVPENPNPYLFGFKESTSFIAWINGPSSEPYKKAYQEYEKSLECAQAEAYIQCPKDGDLFRKVLIAHGRIQEGNMYTINMEDKIEVVNQYRHNPYPPQNGWTEWMDTTYEDLEDGDLPNYEYRNIARIAAPKKVELPWNVGDEGELYYDPLLNRYRGGLLVTEKLGQETVGHVWRDVYYQISGMLKAGKNVYEITEVLQSEFEIKRKPL